MKVRIDPKGSDRGIVGPIRVIAPAEHKKTYPFIFNFIINRKECGVLSGRKTQESTERFAHTFANRYICAASRHKCLSVITFETSLLVIICLH